MCVWKKFSVFSSYIFTRSFGVFFTTTSNVTSSPGIVKAVLVAGNSISTRSFKLWNADGESKEAHCSAFP